MIPSEPRLSRTASTVRTSVFAALQARIDAFVARGGDLIPLQIGDTHLAPPPQAVRANDGADWRDLSSYGAVPGMPELKRALGERLLRLGHGGAPSMANIHVGSGATHALFCAARAVLDPGDEVIVLTPYWPLITGVLSTAGAVPVEVGITQQLYRDPTFDVRSTILRACTDKTRAIYAVSPNNPDGHVFSRAQAEAIASVARGPTMWVFAGEVYADFVYDRTHEPFANLPGMRDRTITAHSLSKSHALAGARIGYVVASEEVIDATRRISNHTVYNVPVPMQRAALAALAFGDRFIAEAASDYRRARDAACDALSRHGIPHHRPMGASFVFLDLERILGGRPLQPLLERAIDRGVLLAPGDAFGQAHPSTARLCFTTVPIADVLRGIDRLAAAVDSFAEESSP
jgi:aspartate/methionine/tyrosine aminotransferase